jgi:hypothetical protein
MVVHTYNLSTWEAEAWDYTEKTVLKKKRKKVKEKNKILLLISNTMNNDVAHTTRSLSKGRLWRPCSWEPLPWIERLTSVWG